MSGKSNANGLEKEVGFVDDELEEFFLFSYIFYEDSSIGKS